MGEHSGAFVAFDVAKTKHAVAVAEAGRAGEVRFLGEVENTPAKIEGTIKKLAARYGRLQVCFEAGPTGYGLDRQSGGGGRVAAGAGVPDHQLDQLALARISPIVAVLLPGVCDRQLPKRSR